MEASCSALLGTQQSKRKHCPYSGTMLVTAGFLLFTSLPAQPSCSCSSTPSHLSPGLGGKAWAPFPQPLPGFKRSPPVTFLAGPPGPPEAVTIDEITDTTAQLSWRPGADNHSPITMYVVQARTPFSVGWQAVSTGKRRAPSTPRGAALPQKSFPWLQHSALFNEFQVRQPKDLGSSQCDYSSIFLMNV